MKVIIEYTMVHGRPLEKGTPSKGVRAIQDQQTGPGPHADFPVHRLEYGVEDGSDAARIICEMLGVSQAGER